MYAKLYPIDTSTSSLASVSMKEQLRIGERVIISSGQGSKTGVLRYLGGTEFANGDWCGVELDEPLGKNDGTVEGKRCFLYYFFFLLEVQKA